ncbi:MAG TPA: hypothetical protein VE685_20440 [Thermoanaerobaculia bacterium]|nr:hypothetical protein [Thermoanaerobaculia bacterium]
MKVCPAGRFPTTRATRRLRMTGFPGGRASSGGAAGAGVAVRAAISAAARPWP